MRQAIWIHASDNVATALEALSKGAVIHVEGPGHASDREIKLAEPIAFGHKFSIEPIESGDRVVKYGETIGRATMPISAGAWVHVHNIESTRGRGDLAGSGGTI